MTFIPEEELKDRGGFSLAPMIDFLFLMLAIFASLAVSRMVLRDTDIELVQAHAEASPLTADTKSLRLLHIVVTKEGGYKWVTEIRDYPMENAAMINEELLRQYTHGLLPKEKLQTQVLLKIDKEARWEPILKALLAIKEAGFEARPLFEPTDF